MSGGADELYDEFLSELDYFNSSGLSQSSSSSDESNIATLKEKLGIDAVYSGTEEGRRTSVVYFKKFEHHSDQNLRELYHRVWNEGRASLLIVILANEIRVYNPNASPLLSPEQGLDNQQRLIDTIDLRNKSLSDASELKIYDRAFIDSREYWRRKEDKFVNSGRVDRHLHDDLAALKEKLEENVGSSIANRLVIKSVFILFLEHRGILTDTFFEQHGFSNGYADVLPNKESTYKLFGRVEQELNGDVFKYTEEEREAVSESDLEWISRFLQGEDVSTGQQRLFPYSFDIIPVELISSIYEDFVPSDDGVFYTPFYLVDFILDDFSDGAFDETSKILDPACGSGVFLVSAFEKLLQNIQPKDGKIEPERLLRIAEENIVGVDRNPEAVQITAFSLSLKILEYLDDGDGVGDIRLPNFIGESIFHSDFFDSEPPFNEDSYDLIVGNPPWIRETDSMGQSYCEENELPTGNNQLAIPFLWKSLDLLSEEGEACLLVPTRDILLNKWTQEFRRQFFDKAGVKSVVNLSILRKRLFSNADNPCSVIKFSKNSDSKKKIQYVTPSVQKPELSQNIWVDSEDIKYLPGSEFNERIWKAAMYGGTEDIELVRRLSNKATIGDFIEEYDLETGEGFQYGGPKETENLEIPQLAHVPTKSHRPYTIKPQELSNFDQTEFHRPRTGTNIWYGPRILVKEGITTTSFPHLRTAYIEEDATFRHNVMAIKGSEAEQEFLKALAMILNSDLAQYYFFMTSSNWGVERGIVEKYEIMEFPFPHVDLPIERLADLHDDLAESVITENDNRYETVRDNAEDIISRAYGLDHGEELLVSSRVRNTIDYFNRKERSATLSPPNSEEIENYINIVTEKLSSFIEDNDFGVSGRYYEEPQGLSKFVADSESHYSSPLNLITLHLSDESDVHVERANDSLSRKISEVNEQIVGDRSGDMHLLRKEIYHVGSAIHVVKPNELRSWDSASAINDVSWLLGNLISGGEK